MPSRPSPCTRGLVLPLAWPLASVLLVVVLGDSAVAVMDNTSFGFGYVCVGYGCGSCGGHGYRAGCNCGYGYALDHLEFDHYATLVEIPGVRASGYADAPATVASYGGSPAGIHGHRWGSVPPRCDCGHA